MWLPTELDTRRRRWQWHDDVGDWPRGSCYRWCCRFHEQQGVRAQRRQGLKSPQAAQLVKQERGVHETGGRTGVNAFCATPCMPRLWCLLRHLPARVAMEGLIGARQAARDFARDVQSCRRSPASHAGKFLRLSFSQSRLGRPSKLATFVAPATNDVHTSGQPCLRRSAQSQLSTCARPKSQRRAAPEKKCLPPPSTSSPKWCSPHPPSPSSGNKCARLLLLLLRSSRSCWGSTTSRCGLLVGQ